MSHRIFISYPHTGGEREWVLDFSKSRKDRGFHVWLDEAEVPPGEDLRSAIEKGLRESDTIV